MKDNKSDEDAIKVTSGVNLGHCCIVKKHHRLLSFAQTTQNCENVSHVKNLKKLWELYFDG